jgi:hypothetical protein
VKLLFEKVQLKPFDDEAKRERSKKEKRNLSRFFNKRKSNTFLFFKENYRKKTMKNPAFIYFRRKIFCQN